MQPFKNMLALTLFIPAFVVTLVGALLAVAGRMLCDCGDEIGSWCDVLAPDLGENMERFINKLIWWRGDD